MASCMAPSEAVVVRLPAQHPRLIAAGNLKIFLPIITPSTSGIVVQMAPMTKSIQPTCWRPLTNEGPELMPMTAINMLRPRLLSSHIDWLGMRPHVGRRERSHPKKRPAMSAPPLVLRLTGTWPRWRVSRPMMPPINMPSPTRIRSDLSESFSAYPRAGEASSISFLRPTMVMTSPGYSFT